jgi:RimJ/RimL family protein N-acetyltransferase
MSLSLSFEPLRTSHLEELASVLLHPAVYEHIEEAVPPLAQFTLGLERAIAGPGPSNVGEKWLNFLVRDSDDSMVGRLEATVHHGMAEVAFLFGPRYWGRGFASAGLSWLHDELSRCTSALEFWATTVPANVRCRRLLQRCGYGEAQLPAAPLHSYDPGDLVFRKRSAP